LLACTIQREVGQRLGAEAGSDAYGPVSVILQILAEVELLAIVPPTAFWPRPQVESVMVTIRPRPPAVTELDDVAGFVRFVRQAFQQRRKMMKKAAEGWGVANAEVVFGRARVNPNVRPEEVAPEQWRELYRSVRAESGPS
jgi:16S rRNA (adenine1518-N6/adenine1519-N6)-dimethyltransferase